MNNAQQKKAFLEYEANAWFERNKEAITAYSSSKDIVVDLLKDYNLSPENVLEIGSSAGYRLKRLQETFPNCSVFGVEPSVDAINYGKEHFSSVNFVNTTADDLSAFETGSMDVVIVGFVFYVIDRALIFQTMAEIDRVLKEHGILIIIDFFSEAALKNSYKHISLFTAYSFKQNYDEMFTASKLYYLLDKSTYNHTIKSLDASNDYHDKYSITLLKKDLSASYK